MCFIVAISQIIGDQKIAAQDQIYYLLKQLYSICSDLYCSNMTVSVTITGIITFIVT